MAEDAQVRRSLRDVVRCDEAYELVVQFLDDAKYGAGFWAKTIGQGVALARLVPGCPVHVSASVGPAGALMLQSDARIQSLSACKRSCWPEVALALRANTGLRRLSVLYCTVFEQLTDALAVNSHISELSLWNCEWSAGGAHALAAVLESSSTLRVLRLERGQVGVRSPGPMPHGEIVVAALATNTSLREVEFRNADVEDDGGAALAAAFASNTSITKLVLSNCFLSTETSEVVAPALARNTTLRELDLSKTGISKRGARYWADALKVNTTLAKLEFAVDAGRNADRGGVAMASALEVNSGLVELKLGGWELRARTGTALAQALRKNHGLQVLHVEAEFREYDDGGSTFPDVFASLHFNTGLHALSLDHCALQHCVGALIDALKVNSTITNLSLKGSLSGGLPDNSRVADLISINSSSLRHLDLMDNCLKDDDGVAIAAALKVNTGLVILNICNNDFSPVTEHALVDALATNRVLRTLGYSWGASSERILTNPTGTCVVDSFLEEISTYECQAIYTFPPLKNQFW